jgi:hypothetical protein
MFGSDALMGLLHAFNPILKVATQWWQLREHTEQARRIPLMSSARVERNDFPNLI